MKLDKSKKYIIMGVAHSGTCSFERYLVLLGYDVIRCETAYRARTLQHYRQLWSDRMPLFIIADKTHHSEVDYVYKYWAPVDPIVFHLNDLKKDPKFPWENKGNSFKQRPDYHKMKEDKIIVCSCECHKSGEKCMKCECRLKQEPYRT